MEASDESSRRRAQWNRLSLAIMGAGVASLVAAAVLFVLILTDTVDGGGYDGPGVISTPFGTPVSVQSRQPTPTSPASVPSPTISPTPPSDAPIVRLAIPKFDVDAPVVVRGVNALGEMETPDGPTEVAWYDFSARPGFGSNAVFSAHVDYINYGPAVFWNLKDLQQDDRVQVRLEDGTVYEYRVVSKEQIDAATTDIGHIVGATPDEVVTLITCGGTFRWDTHQYDQRVIVRAERIFDVAPGQPVGAAGPP